MTQTASERIQRCDTEGLKEAIDYLREEARIFPDLRDVPIYRAAALWMQEELRRRKVSVDASWPGRRVRRAARFAAMTVRG